MGALLKYIYVCFDHMVYHIAHERNWPMIPGDVQICSDGIFTGSRSLGSDI